MASLLLALWTAMALAQGGPELHGGFMPVSPVVPGEGAPVDVSEMTAGVWSWGASTPTPPIHLVRDRWMLVNSVAFEHTRLGYEGAGFMVQGEGAANLFRAQWSVISVWRPSERATLIATVQPGLYSDLKGPLGGADLGLVALGIGLWSFGEGLTAGVGLGYIQLFGRPTLSPFVAAEAEAGRLSVSALVPRSLEVWVELADPVAAGVVGALDGGFYHVHPEDSLVADAFQEYSALTIGPALRTTLREVLSVRVTGAYALRRTLEVYQDADTSLLDLSLEPGWSVGLQLEVQLAGAEEA